MKTQTLDQLACDKILQDWLDLLNGLVTEISEWVGHQPGWSVEISTTEITEEPLGKYTAPVLTINVDETHLRRRTKETKIKGRLILEPIARNASSSRTGGGGTGFVELYAWPALYRVYLLPKATSWVIMTESRVALRQPWNEETFIDTARQLLGAR